jgi:hypothetical protein
MSKYAVTVTFPIKGFEIHELEVKASSAKEAEQKAIEFVQTGEIKGVKKVGKTEYDDIQTDCDLGQSVEYDVEVGEISKEGVIRWGVSE